MHRFILAGLFITAAVLSGGCGEFHQFVHSPFGPGTLCDTSHCGDCGPCGGGACATGGCRPCRAPYYGTWGFGPTWGCGPSASCDARCGPGAGMGDGCGTIDGCGESCGPCGCQCGGCTCGCCEGPGLLCSIFGLIRPGVWFGCYNNGCGEIYWGDFHGDPPDCCDPCNCMGDYTGPGGSGCSQCCGQPTSSMGTPDTSRETPGMIDPSRAAPTKAPPKPIPAPSVSRNPQRAQTRY